MGDSNSEDRAASDHLSRMSSSNPALSAESGVTASSLADASKTEDKGQKLDPTETETSVGGTNSSAVSQQQLPPPPVPTPTHTLLKETPSSTLVPVASNSATSSPKTSRNASPQRKDRQNNPLPANISTQPSAAAIQRALSATSVPSLPHIASSDSVPKQRTNKSTTNSGETTPQWPVSPRLRSPPPSGATPRRLSTNATQKRIDTTVPSVTVENASSAPQSPYTRHAFSSADGQNSKLDLPQHASSSTRQPSQQSKNPIRGPSNRSTLETVQENSGDSIPEPLAAARASSELKAGTRFSDDDFASVATDGVNEERAKASESGSESGGAKNDKKQTQCSTATAPAKSHYSPIVPSKSRKPEATRNMTVETETVLSIPQSGLNAGDRNGARSDASGSIRLKPSNETIRPKKDRKKPVNKSRSLNQGAGTPLASRSPLLLQRPSYESIDGITSSTASVSDEAETGSIPEQEKANRALSLSQHAQRFYSTLRPKRFDHAKSQSDKYPRKASSKADIFEARVASAVDEANSSDSDETFVYESNPPEPQRRPRHHSRTPSVASSHSIADPQRSTIRSFAGDIDERRVAGKRSMKFSTNTYGDNHSPTNDTGTVRSHFPRHSGKHGRGGAQSGSMHDPDSPFTQAARLKTNTFSARHSRPNSPRSPQGMQLQQQQHQGGLPVRKLESPYEFDGNGADDERTPLMGSVRTPRAARYSRRLRNPPENEDEIHPYYGVRRRSRCGGKWSGCLLGGLVFVIVLLSAIGFLVTSNRPMYDVRIRKIQNVLASEQELMLDVLVGAINPNPLGITVTNMDLNVFAKSKYIGDGKHSGLDNLNLAKRKRNDAVALTRARLHERELDVTAAAGNPNSWQDLTDHWHPPGNVDDGTDPMPGDDEDLERDAQTMLLGQIFHFDQSLSFEGSPIKRHTHSSLGELRLPKPGNKTETRGSERWEKALDHPFELILRGVLKYQLPISSRLQTAAVGASVIVHPEDGVDKAGNMRLAQPSHRDHWQWIDWDDIVDDDSDNDLKNVPQVDSGKI